ncbi:hypothetical protein HNR23_005014 [Nocardiopsis mwathae]|uniref:Uncharacterized protein n=1 Tax=Nocardiopsis mwathae TaxID=1472723 RepID=A0A7W9YMM2_9ACTN|nr:hypothetical protein [Nocardiopsis mwathae]MBB6174954.1 hypothetical protein [Nocardiopsis mwathae]
MTVYRARLLLLPMDDSFPVSVSEAETASDAVIESARSLRCSEPKGTGGVGIREFLVASSEKGVWVEAVCVAPDPATAKSDVVDAWKSDLQRKSLFLSGTQIVADLV